MGLQDLILGPVYFLMIMLGANYVKGKIQEEDLKKYFIWGLYLKLIGGLFISLVYFFYYGTGDTVFYYRKALFITDILKNNFSVGLKVLFSNPKVYDYETSSFFDRLGAHDKSSLLLVRIGAIVNIISFNSYLVISFIFSVLSYWGIWRGFKAFLEIFPNYRKEMAISFLFIPSVFFWGSGLFKDCLTFGFLGVLVSSTYYLVIKPKNIFTNLFLLFVSIYVIGTVKSYILMALLPATAVWIFLVYRGQIKNPLLKTLSTPIFIGLGVVSGFFILTGLANVFEKFSIENMQSRAEDMQRWHTYTVEVIQGGEGSSYSLGETDFSATGILRKFPAAVNVALFRPYLWEVRNPLMVLSALESLLILYLTLLIAFRLITDFGRISSFIGDNPTLFYMLIFSVIFAFAVGFTSYNFGALSRYRIPALPFYVGFLLVIRSHILSLKEKRK
jgi:hypothetical protein